MMNNTIQPKMLEVKATQCQRCGRILISEFGLKHEMGPVCKLRVDEEAAAAEIDENQITLDVLEVVQNERQLSGKGAKMD